MGLQVQVTGSAPTDSKEPLSQSENFSLKMIKLVSGLC